MDQALQTKIMSVIEREAYHGRIGAALVALRRPDGEYCQLGDWYPDWKKCSSVPDGELARVAAELEAEARLLKRWGKEKYWETATAAGRYGLYRRALDALVWYLTGAEIGPDVLLTAAEFRRKLMHCMDTLEHLDMEEYLKKEGGAWYDVGAITPF